jgi:hypothetical protein
MDEKYIRLDRRIKKSLPADKEGRLSYLKEKYKIPFKLVFCELCAKTTWTSVDELFTEIVPQLAKNRWDFWVINIDELEYNLIDKTWTFIEKDGGRFSVSKYFFRLCFKYVAKSRREKLDSYGKTYYTIFLKRLQSLELKDANAWLTKAIDYAENEIEYTVKENDYVSLVVYFLNNLGCVSGRAKMCNLWPFVTGP